MKRILISLLVVVSSCAGFAETNTVSGYSNGAFATKGSVERQLEHIARTITAERSEHSRATLEIAVTGYADNTGSERTNDRVAELRAEAAKNYLQWKFPQAHITPLTKGSEADSRMVVVSWHFAPLPPPPHSASYALSMVAIAAVFGLGMFVIISMKRTRHTPKESTEKREESAPAAASFTTNTVWVRATLGDRPCAVEVIRDSQGFQSPFRTQKEPHDAITRRTFEDIKKVVKSCLRNEYYHAEIDQLIATGKIIFTENIKKEVA